MDIDNKLVKFVIWVLNVLIPVMLFGFGAYYSNYYHELYSNTTGDLSDLRFSDFCMYMMFLGMALIAWNLLLGLLSFFKYFKVSEWFVRLQTWSRYGIIVCGGFLLLIMMI